MARELRKARTWNGGLKYLNEYAVRRQVVESASQKLPCNACRVTGNDNIWPESKKTCVFYFSWQKKYNIKGFTGNVLLCTQYKRISGREVNDSIANLLIFLWYMAIVEDSEAPTPKWIESYTQMPCEVFTKLIFNPRTAAWVRSPKGLSLHTCIPGQYRQQPFVISHRTLQCALRLSDWY